jgi:LacI family repressor for deo operon, udp, cdd, tsx, nupC, and nupG
VSRVLASPSRVAEHTRSAVQDAIAATGYTPNITARNLRARKTNMVLALLNAFGDRFYNVIIDAVDEVMTAAGYGIIYGATRDDPEREAHFAQLVRSGQVEGVILLTGTLPAADLAHLDRSVPIALICNDIPGHRQLPLVASDNAAAVRTMIEYLVGLGHRRIAHIIGPRDNIEARERLDSYRKSLAAAGIPADEGLIWEGGTFSFEAGQRAAKRFLAMNHRPTAVFTANDEIAIGFIRTIREAGLSVPRDVSVAGFDDIEYARYLDPPLTTMRQPRSELGRLAAEQLLRRMSGEEKPAKTRLPCTLIVRDSVRRHRDKPKRTPSVPVNAPDARGRRAEASR